MIAVSGGIFVVNILKYKTGVRSKFWLILAETVIWPQFYGTEQPEGVNLIAIRGRKVSHAVCCT
jgi:hypothetical protein